jgi:hypothetical protein
MQQTNKQLLDRIKSVIDDESLDKSPTPDVARMARIESIMCEYEPEEAEKENKRYLLEFLESLSGPSYQVDNDVFDKIQELRWELGLRDPQE